MTPRLLLDANLSPRTSTFLAHRFGLDVVDLLSLGLNSYSDLEVVNYAQSNARVIITFDVGFGRLYQRYFRGQIGVIILRLDDQKALSVNRVLERFFTSDYHQIDLEHSLIVIDEHRVRVSTGL